MRKNVSLAVVLMIALGLFACSGGGGGSDSGSGGGNGTTNSQYSVSGTAASGMALAGATVTLKDSTGNSGTATTASDGTYTLDTTGLVSPFLALVTTATGSKFYSVSADANAKTTINITPLTDLIIRSWYDVQGVSIDTAFGAPGTNPPPSSTAVAVISTVVQNMVQLWLNQAGVTAANFNIISTPFTANGSGLDLVLDQTTVNASTGQITISGGGVTQSSTVTASGGSINIVTTTTGTTGTSTSNNNTVVPVQTAQQTAMNDITTAINNFAGIINAKGASLTASDLSPSLDPNLLEDGLNQNQFAAEVAGHIVEILAGHTVSFTIGSIKSLDMTTNVADVVFLAQSQGLQTEIWTNNEFFFKKVKGIWLLSGNNRVAQYELRAVMQNSQGSQGSSSDPQIEAGVWAPQGTVTGAIVTGGGVWTNAALTPGVTEVRPSGNQDSFHIYNPLTPDQLIPAGTPFTVAITLSSGQTATYTEISNAFTTEAIMITNLTGTTIADAHLGSPLTVNWTLPKTFAIAQVEIHPVVWTGPGSDPLTLQCEPAGPVQSITATTAQVTIPATCSGLPVVSAQVSLHVYGVNGEHEIADYRFGQ